MMREMSAFCLDVHAGTRCQHAGACCQTLDRARRTATSLRSCAHPGTVTPGRRRLLFVAVGQIRGRRTRGPSRATSAATVCSSTGTRGRLCVIHRERGIDALPSACRHFPRKVLHRRAGHFDLALTLLPDRCGAAARPAGRSRSSRPAHRLRLAEPMEGSMRRDALPPLVRPGLLCDLEGYDAWERAASADFSQARPGMREAVPRPHRCGDRARPDVASRDGRSCGRGRGRFRRRAAQRRRRSGAHQPCADETCPRVHGRRVTARSAPSRRVRGRVERVTSATQTRMVGPSHAELPGRTPVRELDRLSGSGPADRSWSGCAPAPRPCGTSCAAARSKASALHRA